jgi:uncharacterized tellurite resistance protein B-like protein
MEMDDGFSDIECIITEPLKFKVALAIGEDAYTSLRCGNKVQEWWDMIGAIGGGAAAAQSSLVATTFFAPHWLLATFGFGVAVTPVGWVVAAAVVSGGAWYGIQKVLGGAVDSRITKVPKFINTPIDVLAVSLFDLLAPLGLKVADADGTVTDDERTTILRYFVRTWGFDERFAKAGIAHLEQHLANFSIEDIARRLAEFKKNSPDCNYEAMSQNILEFLNQVMEADGQIDEAEEMAIGNVRAIFSEAGKSAFSKRIDSISGSVNETFKRTAETISFGLDAAETRVRSLAKDASGSEVFSRTVSNGGKASALMRNGVESASGAARSAFGSSSSVLRRLAARIKVPPSGDS